MVGVLHRRGGNQVCRFGHAKRQSSATHDGFGNRIACCANLWLYCRRVAVVAGDIYCVHKEKQGIAAGGSVTDAIRMM